MISRNASHHSGLRPGGSITLTEMVPVQATAPLSVTVKPMSYLPGRVTGSIALGVKLFVNDVPPGLLKDPDSPCVWPATSSPRAKSQEAWGTVSRQVPSETAAGSDLSR